RRAGLVVGAVAVRPTTRRRAVTRAVPGRGRTGRSWPVSSLLGVGPSAVMPEGRIPGAHHRARSARGRGAATEGRQPPTPDRGGWCAGTGQQRRITPG